MPSYFNLHDFKEKHLTEIEHLSEMFPQIHPDNIALCLNENDCDFSLTVSRLSMEMLHVPHEKPANPVEKQAKRNFSSARTQKNHKPLEKIEKAKKTHHSELKSETISSPIKDAHDSLGEVLMGQSELKDCVFFEMDCAKHDRNIESPCVVFPFNVTSQIATMPISFP